MKQTKQDPAKVFEAFPEVNGDLVEQELEGAGEQPFTAYGFYKPRGRRREYWFTCCQQALECRTSADPYENDDIMRAKHGEGSFCPLCGRQIVNMALGRLRVNRSGTYKPLHEWRNVVRLDWHQGGVLMEAGILDCSWYPGDSVFDGWDGSALLDGECIPEPDVEWRPFRRYFAAPGQVFSWRTSWKDRTHPTREWRQIQDNTIYGGYGGNYLLAERAGVQFASSDIPLFLQDQTVFKGTARYDGAPVAGEAFVVVNFANTSPTTTGTFPVDWANTDLNELTIVAAASASNAGKTVLTVTDYLASESPVLYYKLGTQKVKAGEVIPVSGTGAWSSLTSGTTEITAAAGKKITVVELNAAAASGGVVVSAGVVASVPKAAG